jgi:hypothetical protein
MNDATPLRTDSPTTSPWPSSLKRHHAIKPGQCANLAGSFPKNRRGRAVALDPRDDRPHRGGRRAFLAGGLLEFKHDFVPGAMHRDAEQRAARLELPAEHGFDDRCLTRLLQAPANVVQDIGGKAGSNGLPDDLVVRHAQVAADVLRRARNDPVGGCR